MHSLVVTPDLRHFGVPESDSIPGPKHVRLVKDLTQRRWSSASRLKRDLSLNTMRYQSKGNHDDWLRHHSGRFCQCCWVKCRRLKGRCESNPTSVKLLEMMEGATGACRTIIQSCVAFVHLGLPERVHFINKFLTATIAATIFAQLYLYVAGGDLLLCMTT
ncbi:hypothetical protein TNCV_2118491 [Trichonephila clavipes]|nr:hypothetical protein TNCV_2118491 [Trichonephila clavipes]